MRTGNTSDNAVASQTCPYDGGGTSRPKLLFFVRPIDPNKQIVMPGWLGPNPT